MSDSFDQQSLHDTWTMASATVRSLIARAEISPGVIEEEAGRLQRAYALYSRLNKGATVDGMLAEVYRSAGQYTILPPALRQAIHVAIEV